MLKAIWLTLVLFSCSQAQPAQASGGKNNMAYTHIENFEKAKSAPGSKVNTDKDGSGGDGVYTITEWSGLTYSDRQVYIDDQVTFSGNRSLKHVVRDHSTLSRLGAGEYTNTESTIVPRNWEDPSEGSEIWARMMIYVPSSMDWRSGSSGTGRTGEPKIMRLFAWDSEWVNIRFKIAKPWGPDSSSAPDSYTYKRGGVLGFGLGLVKGGNRYEADITAPWYSGTNIDYRAPWSSSDYDDYLLTFDKWHTLEVYIKFSTDPSKGVGRGWLNEKLLYETRTRTLLTSGRNAPNSRPQIQTLSTWAGGLPTKGGTFYTDEYIITTDPAQAKKTDDRGNKIVGRASGNGNGGDPGEPEDKLAISDHAVAAASDRAVVVWNTNKPANTVVDYGPTENRGTFISDNAQVTEHRVEIPDLSPETQYFYRFSSKTSSGEVAMDPDNSTFTTTKEDVVEPPVETEHALSEHTDTAELAKATRGDVAIYDGTKWVSVNLAKLVEEKVIEVLDRAKIVV